MISAIEVRKKDRFYKAFDLNLIKKTLLIANNEERSSEHQSKSVGCFWYSVQENVCLIVHYLAGSQLSEICYWFCGARQLDLLIFRCSFAFRRYSKSWKCHSIFPDISKGSGGRAAAFLWNKELMTRWNCRKAWGS